MSIPIYFDFYDACGNIVGKNVSFFTISYSDKAGDLNLLSKRIQEIDLNYYQTDVRYIVPHSAPDYMFDLKHPCMILPNRFKIING